MQVLNQKDFTLENMLVGGNYAWNLTSYIPALQVLNENIDLNSCSSKSKRKKSSPHRSIAKPLDQIDRSFQRIVNLDVYKAFKENPMKLLGRKSHHSDSDTESTTSSGSTQNVVPKTRSNSASQSACKVLPAFIVDKEPTELDLSQFQNTKGAPSVSWKGAQPLKIASDMPFYNELQPEEIKTCATLRISPQQYIEIKRTMLTAVKSYGPFKKREAQTWFRIDVNKICIIYDWFRNLGWIPSTEEWAAPVEKRGDSFRGKKLRRK